MTVNNDTFKEFCH
jgi:hypothetical protein